MSSASSEDGIASSDAESHSCRKEVLTTIKYNVVHIYNTLCTHGNCVFSHSAHKERCTVCADVGGESICKLNVRIHTIQVVCKSTKYKVLQNYHKIYSNNITVNTQHVILAERIDYENNVNVAYMYTKLVKHTYMDTNISKLYKYGVYIHTFVNSIIILCKVCKFEQY